MLPAVQQAYVLIALFATRKFTLRSVPEKQAGQDVFNQMFSGTKSLLASFIALTIPTFSFLILRRKKKVQVT